jgi:hypothetical protein
MDDHKRAAYAALHDAADKVRALVIAARSSSHPLQLNDDTLVSMGAALNGLHAAQRDLELEDLFQK